VRLRRHARSLMPSEVLGNFPIALPVAEQGRLE
jgi:hypothetical protein